MNDIREVRYDKYCSSCKYKDLHDYDEPCSECLAQPWNIDSKKPINYKKEEK